MAGITPLGLSLTRSENIYLLYETGLEMLNMYSPIMMRLVRTVFDPIRKKGLTAWEYRTDSENE